MKLFSLAFVINLLLVTNAFSQVEKAPAYPLITHNPYFSIWSMCDTLNQQSTKHWTENDQPMIGKLEVDGKTYIFLGKEENEKLTLLPPASEVKFTEQQPAGKWYLGDFDDKNWGKGKEPFTDEPDKDGTTWKSRNIWERKEFYLDFVNFDNLWLRIRHDDNAEVYLNGILVYSLVGWLNKFKDIPLSADALRSLKKGKNILAVHVENTSGGAWLDAGLYTNLSNKSKSAIIPAKQTQLLETATSTNYQFVCGPVTLNVKFTSPLLIDDLDILGRPVSYVSFNLQSTDGKTHKAKLSFLVSSDLAVNTIDQEVSATTGSTKSISYLKAGTVEQPILNKRGDDLRIDWGYVYVAVPKGNDIDQEIISSDKSAGKSKTIGHRLWLSTSFELEINNTAKKEKYLMLGYDDWYSVQYFYQNLRPWWNKNGTATFEDVLEKSAIEYHSITERCSKLDEKIYSETKAAGGETYAKLCIMAYRQCLAAHTLVQSPEGEILYLSKENFSNGCINTVDITYPSAPLFLAYNPELLKGMLNGIFYLVESDRWKEPFAPHDLGQYPKANGQAYSVPMPVEESGNLLILCGALAKAEGNASYALKHWNTLQTWAEYLASEGLDPKNQLCTDDFAGHLARNANLSIKAILGVKCFAMLSEMAGKTDLSAKYNSLSAEMVKKWMVLADGGDHYALTFDDKGTWSQKYNLVWDKVLGFNLFPAKISETEIQYYLKKQNKFGLPLDSRKTYTKSDWIIWTATLASSSKDFETLINPVYLYATQTTSRIPLSDWHETLDGKSVGFQARSVVGGYYMKLLETKFNKPKQSNQ